MRVAALLPNGKIVIDDGTSFAAPYVAAEAAIIMQEYGWTAHVRPGRRARLRGHEDHRGDGGRGRLLQPVRGLGRGADLIGLTKVQASSSPNGDDLDLVSGAGPGSFGPIYGLPVKMYGAGPDEDGAVASAGSNANRIVAKPYAAAVTNKTAQSQQRWAYIALIIGLVVAAVTLGGAAVARDTGRRRTTAES